MKNYKKGKISILMIAFILIFAITGCSEDMEIGNKAAAVQNGDQIEGENLEIHFIDVGQGDSVFIRQGDSSMLIDAGENHYGKLVVDYLKNQGISKLDYVIGTHPHSDHIGGLDDVITAFEVGKVIMPKVTHTTQTFQDVIMAVKNKGLKITTPKVGDVYPLANAQYTILGPNSSSYSNFNDYSVVLKLEYKETAFMFTGDAESKSEKEVLDLNRDLSVDLLKLGHHGSNTSTIDEFLEQTNPSYGIIQVAEVNSYNLPDKEILDKLEEKNIKIYRTDINGTIKVTSDGKDLAIETEKNSDNIMKKTKKVDQKIDQKEDTNVEKYSGNKNSKIFHKGDCSSTIKDSNKILFKTRDEAISEGYRPCKRCNP